MIRILIAALLLAGCTQTPVTSPTTGAPSSAAPTPTYTCSPAGGTPAPCSKEEYDKAQAENALIAEAEAVYRKYFDENVRIFKAGGSSKPTRVLSQTTTGTFLDQAMQDYRDVKKANLRGTGQAKIKILKPRMDVQKDGSIAALDVCTDATALVFKHKGCPWAMGR